MSETAVLNQLELLEWFALHPGAREVDGAPDWFYQARMPDDTGGPFIRMHVRHRDRRAFDFAIDLWLPRTPSGAVFPEGVTHDSYVLIVLHERYPEEYDEPTKPTPYQRDPLSEAIEAYCTGDQEAFAEHIIAAMQHKWDTRNWNVEQALAALLDGDAQQLAVYLRRAQEETTPA